MLDQLVDTNFDCTNFFMVVILLESEEYGVCLLWNSNMALLKDKRRRIWFNLKLPIKYSLLVAGSDIVSSITALTDWDKGTSFLSIELKDIYRDISFLFFTLLLIDIKLTNISVSKLINQALSLHLQILDYLSC